MRFPRTGGVRAARRGLISNGLLTLLRQPEHLDQLHRDPALLPRAVEELLRYEPPVHMRERIPLADIDVAGTPIAQVFRHSGAGLGQPRPQGAPPRVRFDPTRPDNEHLGFGSGIHVCYGAPLARIEAQAALGALLPHLGTARLAQDTPLYGQNAMLRGPHHLPSNSEAEERRQQAR
ncbi:cytochrome P450 family protein [Streptomyces mirabilis]|uniref:hypothetical protein n=1 Tax=Streptomyces mirabilis TaxID=68239 RepID=UPI0036D9940A